MSSIDHANWMPMDGRVYPRFSGVRTFFRLPQLTTEDQLAQADVAILGVPFDGGTSFRPGARFAPEHVRSMSTLGRGYHPTQDVHIFKRLKIGDAGDVSVNPLSLEQTHRSITDTVSNLLSNNCMPIMVGGDHSTTIGSLRAIADKYGPVGLVHFDAHTDTYPPAWGVDSHHGTFARVAYENNWIDAKRVIQIGIRGPFADAQDLKTPHDYGFQMVTVDDVRINGVDAAKDRIKALGQGPVFVTFDVDCLDPAFAPGTGTPVPGGLTSWEACYILRALADLDVVGADVVEVSPPYDVSGITSLVAVSVIWEILAARAIFFQR